jgi:small subunit ribosomal protein S16
MSVSIRLMRFGKIHYPTYRIVVVPTRSKRDGAYIDKIGSVNPMLERREVILNKEKYESWIAKGAQPSEGVRKIMKDRKNIKFV